MRTIISLTLLLAIASCSKNVKNTNRIHGDYTITAIDGTHQVSDISGVLKFNKCDIPEENYRTYHEDYTFTLGETVNHVRNTGAYTFRDNGKALFVKIPGEPEERKYSVQQLDKRSATITRMNGEHSGMKFSLREE